MEGGGNLIHLNYNIQSTPTAVLIGPDRVIIEQYIWPPTHENLNNAILMAGGIMVGMDEGKPKDREPLVLYPNPARNVTHVVFSSTGDKYRILVSDITGNAVYKSDQGYFAEGRQKIELHLDGLAKGIYFLGLGNQAGTMHSRQLILL